MTDEILVTQSKGTAIVTLNRPEKRNAFHGDMVKKLLKTVRDLREDDTVRVLMINGEGEHFCAGADINWMKTLGQATFSENEEDAQHLADLLYEIFTFPKPTITLTHGAARGGGLGLIAAADIAIAADNATFGFSEVKIGLSPSTISPYVVEAIGARQARRYFLTGEVFDATAAERMNLVHQVVPLLSLEKVGANIASELMKNGPHALVTIKNLIYHIADQTIDEDLTQKTAEHLASIRATDEAKEGLMAFLEKRKPSWVG